MMHRILRAVFYVYIAILFTACSHNQETPRRQNFNQGWLFCKGALVGAESPDYDDSSWRKLDLPHDWSVEPVDKVDSIESIGPFSRASVGGTATGQTVGGEGWYRKRFKLDKSDEGKLIELYFEGAYNQSEVWINGKRVGENVYGYSAFRFDITEYCQPAGVENVVAVRVVNEGKNSRWYAGSGIYRHVWLVKTSPIHLDPWDIFVKADSISEGNACIRISARCFNKNKRDINGELNLRLFAPNSNESFMTKSVAVALPTDGYMDVVEDIIVEQPLLWSAETPSRYRVEISLMAEGKVQDCLNIPFGIRTLEFTVDRGLLVNGVPTLLKGGCVHHDHGLLGAAAYDVAEERKVKLLKQQGYNALRGSHNPMSEHFLYVCDSLGMYVIDEAFDSWQLKKNKQDYHLYFNEWSQRDIQTLIRRDRNHPSVIMYSIGNEIRERNQSRGKRIANQLRQDIYVYDSTRVITAGINGEWNKTRTARMPLDTAFSYQDVIGGNYMWYNYEKEHEKHPEKVFYGSESVIGEYSDYWEKVETLPYVIGDFSWTAMDYLGEAGIGNTQVVKAEENVHFFMEWPWFNGWCGDIDLIGVKKPQSYYRDVIWRQRDITMAVNVTPPPTDGSKSRVSFWGWEEEKLSWTYPDSLIGQNVKVNVYTRAPKVKLLLNGKEIGENKTDNRYKASFDVPYTPGELKAIAIGGDYNNSEVVLKTAGTPTALRLTADKDVLNAADQDLSYILVELIDSDGNHVFDNQRHISFSCKGVGEIIAAGNGSPNDMESFRSNCPKLFDGWALIIVKNFKDQDGDIKLLVNSDGLPSAELTLKSF